MEATPSKRINIDEELSTEIKIESSNDVEMECCSSQDQSYGLSPLSQDILYEATSHNNNILHVCCASREHEERQKQGFIPFQGMSPSPSDAIDSLCPSVDNLVYQSISLQPEYRHLSFEELHYKNRNKGYTNNNKEEKKDPEELNTAHLNILDSFLTCAPLQSNIIKLVSTCSLCYVTIA